MVRATPEETAWQAGSPGDGGQGSPKLSPGPVSVPGSKATTHSTLLAERKTGTKVWKVRAKGALEKSEPCVAAELCSVWLVPAGRGERTGTVVPAGEASCTSGQALDLTEMSRGAPSACYLAHSRASINTSSFSLCREVPGDPLRLCKPRSDKIEFAF